MDLANGFYDVPAGRVATVVTHLEMRQRASPRATAVPQGVSIRRVDQPDASWYRDLYRRVGEDWLWFSRLKMEVQALERIIRSSDVEIHALVAGGRDEGLLELDFREPGACELVFFGVTRLLIGSGAGRLLMNEAISRAWARPIDRFWVHTCTLDHPGALVFYERSGFRTTRQQIEIADDPRLAGLLPRTAAPHVPMCGPT